MNLVMIPLSIVASMPTPGAVSASLGGSSLQDHQARAMNFGTWVPGQSEAEASLFEPQLGRELLYANQPRSWDPMVEEAAMCAASHNSQEEVAAISEQLAKEPLKMNIRSGSSTPLQAAMFPRVVVDHHPPSEDIQIQSPVMFRSEAELLIGYKLIKALNIFKHSLVTPLSLSTQQNISLEKRAFVVHQGGNQSCSQQRKIKIKF
jgi:hypothetical protein